MGFVHSRTVKLKPPVYKDFLYKSELSTLTELRFGKEPHADGDQVST